MFVWDILFPRICGCGYLGAYICPSCEKQLKPLLRQSCLYCGKQSLHGTTHPNCLARGGVDASLSLFKYNNTLKRIIKTLKYSLVRESFSDLLYIVAKAGLRRSGFFSLAAGSSVVPVPLSPGKTRVRGFNQARIVGAGLARLLDIPLLDIVERVGEGPAQAQTARTVRRRNVHGVFRVKKGAAVPARAIVVDDVITTGETVKELARVLKKGGVQKVFAFSVAKG